MLTLFLVTSWIVWAEMTATAKTSLKKEERIEKKKL